MIVVTGAAGFIGGQLIKGLNALGHHAIIAVDDLSNGHQYANLLGAQLVDYQDKAEFLQRVMQRDPSLNGVTAIFHLGACSDTTEWDGKMMLENNYTYSKILVNYAQERAIPFVYASSAATYGASTDFSENQAMQMPLNVYGYSKYLFDQYVKKNIFPQLRAPVVGLRYFNVYGPGEAHKNRMASVAWHFMNQLLQTGSVKLFSGSHGLDDGEQQRDFIYVNDVVAINVWVWQHGVTGIFNCGSGQARTFNALANALIQQHGSGQITYIPFPADLAANYQPYTQADMSRLRLAGYDAEFTSLEQGLAGYYQWFKQGVGLPCSAQTVDLN